MVQNEKFDDWFPTLTSLRQTFTDYKKLVLEYHHREGITIPAATNSTAAQGNFLEVLNISLNTFEKHFINRNLDRTGQQAIVVTPGAGIFEVDRDLTVITKQRIIDSGVGSDLICVGEQPLHAVPLFKMHTRGGEGGKQEDFSMPHWINLSFYTTQRKIGYSSFVPRIKLPPLKNPKRGIEAARSRVCYFPPQTRGSYDFPLPNSSFAYDEYDEGIFGPKPKTRPFQAQGLSGSQSHLGKPVVWADSPSYEEEPRSRRGSMDDSVLGRSTSRNSSTTAILIPANNRGLNPEVYSKTFTGDYRRKEGSLRIEPGKQSVEERSVAIEEAHKRPIFGSAGSMFEQGHLRNFLGRQDRALVNPFDPSHTTVKLTSNRRRWTHIFPKGPSGSHQQAHLQQTGRSPPTSVVTIKDEMNLSSSVTNADPNSTASLSTLQKISDVSVSTLARETVDFRKESCRNSTLTEMKLGSFLWGAMKDLTRDATLVTGVDWKSINFPACLPITTDYFPDKSAFHNDYVVNQHELVPEELNADYQPRSPMQKGPMTTREVFLELVSQRLAQGFQLIISSATEEGVGREEPAMTASFTGTLPGTKQKTGATKVSTLLVTHSGNKLKRMILGKSPEKRYCGRT